MHMAMIRLDLMHILLLGVYHWTLGSSFWELLEAGEWREPADAGPWQQLMLLQLHRAWLEFKAWARRCKISHSVPRFTLAGLSMQVLDDAPYYKSKAAHARIVCDWMAQKTRTIANADMTNRHNVIRANCLWGFASSLQVCTIAETWLNDSECRQLEDARNAALHSHSWLWCEALEIRNVRLWPTKPKHHLYDHCLRTAQQERLNPLTYWTPSDEDFVGRCSRACRNAHRKTREIVSAERFMLQLALSL